MTIYYVYCRPLYSGRIAILWEFYGKIRSFEQIKLENSTLSFVETKFECLLKIIISYYFRSVLLYYYILIYNTIAYNRSGS